jgi:hypothetical protein
MGNKMEHDLDELADAAQSGRRQMPRSRTKSRHSDRSRYGFNDSSHRVLTEQTAKKYKLAMLVGLLIAWPATLLLVAFSSSLNGNGIFDLSEQVLYFCLAVSIAVSILGWIIYAWGRFGKWWNHD